MQQVDISHINECFEKDFDIVINCTGVHARKLGGVEDLEVYPARGQTVVVQLPQKYVNWAFLRHPSGSNTARPCTSDFFLSLSFIFVCIFKLHTILDGIEMTYVI